MKKQNTIMIVAGEASGDLHGAQLAIDLKKAIPDLYLSGLGGSGMQQAGVDLLADISHFSVCGFVEIVAYLPKFYSLFKYIKHEMIQLQPDLLILIDYPTFNLKLAQAAKKRNIKVLYYISPQIWAWHTGRIKIIKKYVHMMGVIFPFEIEFYRYYGVPVRYVGHPLVGKVTASAPKSLLRKDYAIPESASVVGLLPGSRKNEIKYVLPTLIKAAEWLQQRRSNVQFILPVASTLRREEIQPYLVAVKANITVITEKHYDAMSMCDVVVAASGTVTLELTLLGVPMVIVYKANKLSFAIAKRLINIPHIGLCNIVAGKQVVQELLQKEAKPENISAELEHILMDHYYRDTQKEQLANVAKKLAAEKECSIAELALTMLQ